MNTYIKSVPVNLFNGILNTVINFNNGLNIVSGINGTGKTQLLQLLKGNSGNTSDANKKSSELAIFAISPKRNTEKQAIDSIFQQVRTQNKTVQSFLTNISNFQIKDTGFETYPSFAELFIQEYESIMQDGVTGHAQAIATTITNFNEVLEQVFPDYKIEARWIIGQSETAGKLDIKIRKYSADPINIDLLSTGEREVFALLFCIFVSRDKEDVYLIDEPEIHLNWDLEKGLFQFFQWFCEKFKKQIIVVTHSRIIFKKEFYPKTQFLIWEAGKIVCRTEVTEKQKASIAGEISETINVIQFSKTTYFVEDLTQKLVVDTLATSLGKDIEVIICENKSNVKSLYNLLKNSQQANLYFLVDGDNEGCNIADTRFISLKKYCIENYIFDIALLGKSLNKTDEEVKSVIVESFKEINENRHSLVYKKLAEVAPIFPLEVIDTFNGKDLLKIFSGKVNKDSNLIITDFISTAHTEGSIQTVFTELMIGLS